MKRRISKRRQSAAPVEAWNILFASGHDFLRQLEDYGFPDEAAAREGAREAWRVHGPAFMENWQGTDAQPRPWALDTFGEPGGRA